MTLSKTVSAAGLWLAVPMLLTGLPLRVLAQQPAQPPAMSLERFATLPALARLPASAIQSPALTELTINWNVGTAQAANVAGGATSDSFQVVDNRPALGPMALERAPEFSEDRLVVIAVNAQGNEVGWQMVPDPSLLRAEVPGPNGTLTGQVLRRPQTSFLITVPQTGPPITQLRVYRPRWTGNSFVMDPTGTVVLPNPLPPPR